MLFVAQSGFAGLDAAAPTALPDSPLLSRYLLESPWLAVISLVGISMILFAFWTTRQAVRPARIAAIVGAMLACGVVLLGLFVQTPVEAMKARAVQLVRLTAASDVQGVEDVLTRDAVLRLSSDAQAESRARILVRVQSQFGNGGMYEVKDLRIIELQACETGPGTGRVQIKVSANPAMAPFPVPSWWRLDFEQVDDGSWAVGGIELLSVGGGISIR
ncbi:MAG: hypothetical protein NTV94_06515 [Planctomycetota bacterium]|nr:hypothetical protein [Planctomycetota bacterium]